MPITRTPIVDDDGSGTTGTVLDNAWKQELYNQIDAADSAIAAPTLIGHELGAIPGGTAAGNVSGFLGSPGLQPFETILLEIELHFSAATIPITLRWLQTAAPNLVNLNTFGNSNAGQSITRIFLRRLPGADTYMHVLIQGGGDAPTQAAPLIPIDGWSKAWAVNIIHGGVPAGGFLNWKWSVTKISS